MKFNSRSDEYFLSANVIKFKRDKRVKLAIDYKILNETIHKNKYQILKIEILKDTIQQIINASAPKKTIYFSKLDLKYAYSQ